MHAKGRWRRRHSRKPPPGFAPEADASLGCSASPALVLRLPWCSRSDDEHQLSPSPTLIREVRLPFVLESSLSSVGAGACSALPALHSVALVLFCLHAKVTNYLTRHEQLSETNRPGGSTRVTDAQLLIRARRFDRVQLGAVDTHTPLESPHADILHEPGTFVRTLRGGASC